MLRQQNFTSGTSLTKRDLSYNEAVVCWIARWLNQIYPSDPRFFIDGLSSRYRSISPFRFYEVFEGKKCLGSREDAIRLLNIFFPQYVDRIDFSYHRAKFKRSPIDFYQDDLFSKIKNQK